MITIGGARVFFFSNDNTRLFVYFQKKNEFFLVYNVFTLEHDIFFFVTESLCIT